MHTELLLACLSMNDVNQNRELMEQAVPEDWENVYQLSRQMGVTSLVYQRLHCEPTSLKITSEIQEHLRNVYLACIADNLRLYKAIEEMLRALRDADIPVIPLKGVYLAEKVYLNIGLRSMIDVDLLVKSHDLAHAVAVLRELGYHPGYSFDIAQECQTMHHLPTLYKQGTHSVDLHWNLIPPNLKFRTPIEQIWQAAQPVNLAGVEVLQMMPEDFLLHLCLHAAYLEYFSSGLRPICDLAWTVNDFQDKIDWRKLLDQARSWRTERSVFLALRVAHRLLGVTLPEDIMNNLQPEDYDPNLESWAIKQILEPTKVGRKLARVWVPQPLTQRMRLFAQYLFPAPREIRHAYPRLAHGILWLQAYLKHLRYIFQHNWQNVWRLLHRDPRTIAFAEQSNQVNKLVSWQSKE